MSHVLDAAPLEHYEDRRPELGALDALEPHPEHVTLGLHVDADRHVS
jgi:hypothetical protein